MAMRLCYKSDALLSILKNPECSTLYGYILGHDSGMISVLWQHQVNAQEMQRKCSPWTLDLWAEVSNTTF